MKKKVLITLSFPPEMIAGFDSCISWLEGQGFAVVVDPRYQSLRREELIPALKGVYAHVASGEFIDEDVLSHADSLKIVSRMGVGYDRVDVEALSRRGIALTITPGANADAVAEYAVAMMMTLTRKVAYIDQMTRKGKWNTYFGSSIIGKTLGIIGLGNIGKRVAKYLSGFDMRVFAFDPYLDEAYAAQNNITKADLDQVLEESDYLFLHAPYTQSNRHLLSFDQFAKMKPTAFFINCARGELVDEQALYAALKNKQLAGAALDVFEVEPLPKDSPLWGLDNVILSSHTAGMTFEGRKNVIDMAFQNIVDIANGVRPKGLVNPEALD